MDISAKNAFKVFFLDFSETVIINLLIVLCYISSIKMLLLSHQINYKIFFPNFFLSPKEKVAMTAWTTKNEAKAYNTVGGASLRGGLDKSRML